MAKEIIIPGLNLLTSLTEDWGGENNTGETITKYGAEIPNGYKWAVNFAELERFIKQMFGANTELINAVSSRKIGCLRTWDDEENSWTYVWFNAGQDIADRMHVWNEDMTVPIAADTVRMADAGADFYISAEQDLRNAVDEAARRGLTDFYFLFEDPQLAYLAENARQMVMDRSANTVLNYFWKDRILLLGFLNVYWR